MEQETARHNWGINLLIATSVVVTVFMALLMSQLDTLRTRLVIEPTVIAFVTQPILTATSVPTTPLPTVTATAVPPSPMPTTDVTVAATAVPMLPVCGDIPAGWVPYIVRPGDSYFFLSANSGATIAEIIQANCLDGNVLLSGIQIYLPAQPPVRPVCGPPATWERYVVQAGDTLFSLAQRRGTTVYAVMQANCLSSSYLFAGRQIYLPPLPVTATPFPRRPLYQRPRRHPRRRQRRHRHCQRLPILLRQRLHWCPAKQQRPFHRPRQRQRCPPPQLPLRRRQLSRLPPRQP
ncbi:MAG: LysM peptidoglycan-binding domain-containing protein [Chloroflexota bacterium]